MNRYSQQRNPREAVCGTRRERGNALIFSLIALVGMIAAGAALTRSVDTGNLVAGNMAFRLASLQTGDLGVEKAVGHLQKLLNGKKTEVASENYSPTYGENPAPPETNAVTSDASGNEARYLIERLCRAPNDCLGAPQKFYRVTVQVQGPRNTETWVQAFLKTRNVPFGLEHAILSGGNLKISGNATIKNGSTHANGNTTVSGSPSIDGTVSSSLVTTNTGSSVLKTVSGASVETIPSINPAEFRQYAEYIFTRDGKVLDAAGKVLADLSKGEKWNGWDYSVTADGAKWTMSANDSIDGRFYIEGDAVVSGNPGQAKPEYLPWSATLLAEGDIEISGTPVMKNYTGGGTSVPDGVKNLLFVAGLDLKINGNLQQDQAFQGIMAAHEQVDISGNPSLGGYIIAEDAANTSNTATEISISGNMELASGAKLATPFSSDKPTRIAWRELER